MDIRLLTAVKNGIGILFIAMLIILIFVYIRYWIVGRIEERKWAAWKCPFPADDGYTEYGIDDLAAEYRRQMKRNSLLATEKYEGEKVALKGLVRRVYPDGNIVIRAAYEGSDSPVSCHTPNGSRVLDTIRQLVCGKSVVYIRGRIISGNELTVEVDDIAVYDGRQ